MKLSIQLGFLSAISIGLNFVFQWYVLTQHGPGVETDALFAGMTIPQLVLAVISGSVIHVLVPLLSGENEVCLRNDAWGFFFIIGSLFGLLAILFYMTAPWWVPFAVPGFTKYGRTLTVLLTRIQLIGMAFMAVNGVQWAVYHARQQFLWAEFTPILSSAFSLLLLIWALPRFGIVAAAWIITLRVVLQTLLLAPGMGRPLWPDLKNSAVRQAWRRIKPLLLGSAYYKTDPLIDRFLLSTAASGALSLYYLAQQIYSAIGQVLNKAFSVPLVPMLSRLHKDGNQKGFQRAYHHKSIQVGVISLVGLLVLTVFGQTLLGLLIGHGNVSARNVTELWWIMIWLAGMFFGSVAGQISASSFFALGDTLTPTRVGIYSYTLYIPLKISLFYYFGVFGLALSTSLFYIVNMVLQYYLLRIRHFKLLSENSL